MILIILVIIILGRVGHIIVSRQEKKAGAHDQDDEENIDEGLGRLFDCMDGKE